MSNPNYDTLAATTLKHYIKKLEEQIFTSKPLLWVMKAAGVFESQDGGTAIVQPLLYEDAPNRGSYSGTEVFDTSANRGITAAEFPWKQYYGLIHWSGIEVAQNSGKSAVIKLLDARVKQLEMTMSEDLEAMFFADGSGNAGKDFYGLGAVISATNPSWGNFGGIDRSTNTYWQSTVTDVGASNLTLAQMRTLYNTVSEGNDHPTNIFTTQNAFEAYEALLQPSVRFEDTAMADGNFQNLMFKGAPITYSGNVTAGELIMANFKYIKFTKLGNVWFKQGEAKSPINQDATFQTVLCYGNLTANNCKRQGKLTGIDNG